ncbi:MAG TPA: tRNA 2-thiouridine(34) synthase MnmA [Terriglobales bacterium]|nr:tRNA 2-thiouridine(34) synthase MnmA [Terriglobales bacterium]
MIAVAMSGGVDSSTVAALLHAQGEPIVGLTMQLWNQRRLAGAPGMAPSARGRCCSLDDVHDARRVAEQLGIPYYVVNFEERFERDVVKVFLSEYRAGRTPVPCSLCNSQVKFDSLLTTARQIGADAVATGHYARVQHNPESGAFELLRALDTAKDQTFFLWGLNQEQLAAARFPLGGMHKPEVRAQAAALGLAVADKPDSHEICFVPGDNYNDFLSAYAAEQGEAEATREGAMVTSDGRVVGRHQGIEHFTVGQRKGLGLATGNPLYVIQVDAAAGQVMVGPEEELMARELAGSGCNWIAGDAPSGPVRVEARIRHRHTPAAAWAEPLPSHRLRVTFDAPQRAITPGQAVVLYQGEKVIGGAWIDGSRR